VKLPLIVNWLAIDSVVVASSSPPLIVRAPVPSALALPTVKIPAPSVVPPL
jgi:hypothetical protein